MHATRSPEKRRRRMSAAMSNCSRKRAAMDIAFSLSAASQRGLRASPSSSLSKSAPSLRRRTSRRTRISPTACQSSSASSSSSIPAAPSSSSTSVEQVFALDAGRDLFFTAMDQSVAISILQQPLGTLESPDDRFIAAERLKFFVSEQSTAALLSFITSFETHTAALDTLPSHEHLARRKAVETLGRHAGKFSLCKVTDLLTKLTYSADKFLAETAAWSLGQLPVLTKEALSALEALLYRSEEIPSRVVLHALTAARHTSCVPIARTLTLSPHVPTASAAYTAVALLANEQHAMENVVRMLRDTHLASRRAAAEDLTTTGYKPGLQAIVRAPLSFVLRSRAARAMIGEDASVMMTEEDLKCFDRLLWDHPQDLDLLGVVKAGKRARDVERNVRGLYKNDALDAYVACKVIIEDCHERAGQLVLESYVNREYFDYFGAYHAFKTLGWLRYSHAFSVLEEAARTLPMRFFNHRVAAILSLAELKDERANVVLRDIFSDKSLLWQLKYACLIAAERLGEPKVREALKEDQDWLVRTRARSALGFEYLWENM